MLATATQLDAKAIAPPDQLLGETAIRETLEQALSGQFTNARVLILIPDHTRTLPLPLLFRLLADILTDTSQLDFMVALGTHPPVAAEALLGLVGLTRTEYDGQYSHIRLLNHEWDNPNALKRIGTLEQAQIKALAGNIWHPSLGGDVPVKINRLALEYDQIIILGPTFPHEVVGFSGGAKYLFPGISGAEVINVTHWLGALITILKTIGIEHTPMRDIIHAAAELITTPIKAISLTVVGDGLAGIFIGSHQSAFSAAAALSSERHIKWVEHPYQRILSVAPAMYDELWVAAKAMYKLEPIAEDGGELIVYAPHLKTVSQVHGELIYRVGYHIRDYFLEQWDRFKDIPLSVLAHSTHFRGVGTFNHGVEQARIRVTLASKISAEDCKRLNLGYVDPMSIDVGAWQSREDDRTLVVPKAGEILYRVMP